MKHQLQTIREALKSARLTLNATAVQGWNKPAIQCSEALTILDQLEAMAGEPVAWIDGGDLELMRKHGRGCIAWGQEQSNAKTPLYATPVAQQPLTRSQVGEVLDAAGYDGAKPESQADFINGIRHAEAYRSAQQPQAEAVLVVDRVYEAAKRLVDHADFQLGGVLSAKSKTRDIPSNAASKVKARHLASLRDALAKTPQQAEAVPADVAKLKAVVAAFGPNAPVQFAQDTWAGIHAELVALLAAAPQQAEAVPNVCASFLTESADMIGTTKAPIKRVEREDDGTLHIYIDHWPQQAEAVPSDVVRMDWIAMHGSFGVDSVTGLPGGNGQKRIAATRAAIDAAMAQGEKP